MPIGGKTPEKQYRNFIIFAVLLVLLLSLAGFFFVSSGDYVIVTNIWQLLKGAWWIIFPIPVWYTFRFLWTEYTEFDFAVKQQHILLEVKPPADTEKSPKIMEQLFAGIHDYSTSNKFEIYCGWRPMQNKYSFEIVSLGGKVHFFVRCPKAARDNVEAQIYAQYPDAEIFEVDDYTKKIPKLLPNKDWDVWGSTLALVDNDAVPIRTYRDFKEDITGTMIDPLSSLIEVMSKVKPDQYMWFQINITPLKESEWQPQSKAFVEKLIGKAEEKKMNILEKGFKFFSQLLTNVFRGIFSPELDLGPIEKSVEKIKFNINELTPGDQERLKAIQQNMGKPAYATSMRYVYVGKREGFNKPLSVAGFWGAIKQFADPNLNSLYPDPNTKTFANYYFTEPRLRYRQRKIVQDYRDRAFQGTQFVFNIEELATVFHFPDMSVKTPALGKVESKKGDAPANLPTIAG